MVSSPLWSVIQEGDWKQVPRLATDSECRYPGHLSSLEAKEDKDDTQLMLPLHAMIEKEAPVWAVEPVVGGHPLALLVVGYGGKLPLEAAIERCASIEVVQCLATAAPEGFPWERNETVIEPHRGLRTIRELVVWYLGSGAQLWHTIQAQDWRAAAQLARPAALAWQAKGANDRIHRKSSGGTTRSAAPDMRQLQQGRSIGQSRKFPQHRRTVPRHRIRDAAVQQRILWSSINTGSWDEVTRVALACPSACDTRDARGVLPLFAALYCKGSGSGSSSRSETSFLDAVKALVRGNRGIIGDTDPIYGMVPLELAIAEPSQRISECQGVVLFLCDASPPGFLDHTCRDGTRTLRELVVMWSAAIIRPPPPQALRMQGKPRSTYEAHKQQQLRPERLLQPWERRHRICVVGGKLGTATIEVKQNTSLAEAQGVAEATVAISDDEEYEGASESVFGWSRRRDRPFPQPGGRAINEEQWLRRAVWVTGLESTG